MGLDMYAVRRTFIEQWEGQPPEQQYEISIKRGGNPVHRIDTKRINGVEEEIMYWRKANQIFGWFDDRFHPGIVNCERYRIPLGMLQELHADCQKVIQASELVEGFVSNGTVYTKENPEGLVRTSPGKVIKDATVASELLPTREGFFFGSQDFDQHYLEDVIATRDWLEKLFEEVRNGASQEVYFYASW